MNLFHPKGTIVSERLFLSCSISLLKYLNITYKVNENPHFSYPGITLNVSKTYCKHFFHSHFSNNLLFTNSYAQHFIFNTDDYTYVYKWCVENASSYIFFLFTITIQNRHTHTNTQTLMNARHPYAIPPLCLCWDDEFPAIKKRRNLKNHECNFTSTTTNRICGDDLAKHFWWCVCNDWGCH